jgi:voltage-gated potassium channel
MSGARPTSTQLPPYKFSFLLAALVLVLIISPLTETTPLGGPIFTVGLTAVFISGVLANRERKWVFRSALVIAAFAIPMSWVALFTKSGPLDLSQYFIVVIFCGMTAAMILFAVMREYMATRQAVVGAICVYLLIGLTWAMIYSAIEYIEKDPFAFPDHRRIAVIGVEHTAFSQWTYFSFVTMSTLGYGDITPRTALSETACWMQSIVGQLYVSIIIARLVSALTLMHYRREELMAGIQVPPPG